MSQGYVVLFGMVDKKRSNIYWIKVSAISSVVAIIVVIIVAVMRFWGPLGLIPTINPSTDPSVLTAKIKSFPYRHAETDTLVRREEWREKWLQPLEYELKKRDIAPEVHETVVAVMEDILKEQINRDLIIEQYSISQSINWYSVTIRNDGDVPLKGVFLKFPLADFWIDESGRLTSVPRRIEIGDMDQKSEKRFTFWGDHFGSISEDKKGVLGHSNGIGTMDFD